MTNNAKIIEGISNYYGSKITEFGPTAGGVDWNSLEGQHLRFTQLLKIINTTNHFSLLDYGCGYGELVNYLQIFRPDADFDYTGYDVSEKMIDAARENVMNAERIGFTNNLLDNKYDYCVASGIFNVRLDLADDDAWLKYILATLDSMNALTTNGFSFNALTKYSDSGFMKDYLYYADPLLIFDYCKRNYSRNVALLHDYGLYEFSILVRKDG